MVEAGWPAVLIDLGRWFQPWALAAHHSLSRPLTRAICQLANPQANCQIHATRGNWHQPSGVPGLRQFAPGSGPPTITCAAWRRLVAESQPGRMAGSCSVKCPGAIQPGCNLSPAQTFTTAAASAAARESKLVDA